MKASHWAMVVLTLGATLSVATGRLAAQTYGESPGSSYEALNLIPRPVSRYSNLGFRLGDFRLHAGGALGTGFDSNVFFASGTDGVDSALLLMVMPSLRLDTPSPRTLRFRTNFQLLWTVYAFEEDPVQSQGGIQLLSDASLQIGPNSLVSVSLYDVLRRRISGPGYPGQETQDHLYNEAGLTLQFHPGGADRTSRFGFTGELTGGYGIGLWNESLELDSDLFVLRWIVKYHFFPLTAVYLRGSWTMLRYDVRERTAYWTAETVLPPLYEAFAGAPLINVDSMPLRLYAGLAGLLTRRINLRLEGGYGFGFYEEGPSFEDYLARVEVGAFLTPEAHLSVGWEHGFADSTFSNFYAFDRFSTQLKVDLDEWLIGGQVGLEYQRFAAIDVPTMALPGGEVPLFNKTIREDPLLRATAFVAYNLADWFRLSLSYLLQANWTPFTVTTFSPSGQEQYRSYADYLKHELFLATEFEY